MSAHLQRFRSWLNSPIDGHVIGLFRLVFGLFMVYYTYYYYSIGFISQGLVQPKVHFKYDMMHWVPLFAEPVLYGILVLMGLAAVAIAAGWFFRWACWIFSICLAYFFFQEVSYYNNHIYLFILLPLLLSATNADKFFSLRTKSQSAHLHQGSGGKSFRNPQFLVPRWQQFILQAQIVIVYFYAGIVKFKSDWLVRQEPITSLIQQFPDQDWIAPLIKHDFNIYLFTYGGFALDLLAPFLLWYKPVRNWAWIPFALFHLMNSQVFDDISIFPFVMLASMVLFFDTKEIPLVRQLALSDTGSQKERKQKKQAEASSTGSLPQVSPLQRNLLIGYFVFQILFPLRGFLLPNPLDYTTIGNRFAWRVKADTRRPEEMRFTVQHQESGEESQVNIQSFLNPMQIKTLATDPRTTRDFARFLKEEVSRQVGMSDFIVKARIRFGYNGRPPQFFIDPEVDLSAVDYSPFEHLSWVMPVKD